MGDLPIFLLHATVQEEDGAGLDFMEVAVWGRQWVGAGYQLSPSSNLLNDTHFSTDDGLPQRAILICVYSGLHATLYIP